jgi:hypothetical protein
LQRLDVDCQKLENALLARDGQQISPSPPVTEPVEGSVDYDTGFSTSRGYRRI